MIDCIKSSLFYRFFRCFAAADGRCVRGVRQTIKNGAAVSLPNGESGARLLIGRASGGERRGGRNGSGEKRRFLAACPRFRGNSRSARGAAGCLWKKEKGRRASFEQWRMILRLGRAAKKWGGGMIGTERAGMPFDRARVSRQNGGRDLGYITRQSRQPRITLIKLETSAMITGFASVFLLPAKYTAET